MGNEKKQIKKENLPAPAEECPLCKISPGTLEKLKQAGEQKNKNKSKIEEKSKI